MNERPKFYLVDPVEAEMNTTDKMNLDDLQGPEFAAVRNGSLAPNVASEKLVADATLEQLCENPCNPPCADHVCCSSGTDGPAQNDILCEPGRPHDDLCADGVEPCGETHLLIEDSAKSCDPHSTECSAGHDGVTHLDNPPPVPDAPKPLAFDAGQLMQQMQDVYSKCGPTDLLFALRCPCGQLMALGIPRDYYAKTTFKRLMVQMLQNFVPVLGEHLELLSEKIESADSVPLKERGHNHPTKEQIIAEYHNHPCPLRTSAPDEADVASELDLKEATTVQG